MDKKTKFQQSSTKGAAGDSKKSQDVANNKLFPKASRKREPSGANNFFKNDQPRKYNTQKTKAFDKRPKSKGQYHGSSKEDPKVVDDEAAEVGSVLVHGSKKQNLNHLLNFHYEPRDVQGSSSVWSRGKTTKCYNRNGNRWLPPVQRHKYNKEQFLQASCQFVVTANEDYSLHLADPDVLVDWKFIEQIKVYSTECLSCPICLYSPIAAKMTRCGHVYCWPCILHYLSLSDKAWQKCPICYESIHKLDLKSVMEVRQNALNVGDNVTLRLMRREKGSLIAVPVVEPTASPTTFFSVSDNNSGKIYSKLLIANASDIMDIIERERTQLKFALLDDPDSPENCYIEQTFCELLKREETLLRLDIIKSVKLNENLSDKHIDVSIMDEHRDEEKRNVLKLESQDTEEDNSVLWKNNHSINDQIMKTNHASLNENASSSNSQKFFYFYQAEDGQHVYLHAMNVKMLEMQYGSLEHCPRVITGKLLEKEAGSSTEELRRRLRYICHLPLTCQFEVAEIELKPPIVSDQVLRSFHEQIESRQKCRQRRERDERKREKKIIEEENKRMGRYPTPNVHIESQRHFPQWQPTNLIEDIPSSSESVCASSIASSPSLSTCDDTASIRKGNNTNEQGPSFAEMLRKTDVCFKSRNTWQSLGTRHATKSTMNVEMQSINSEEDDYASVPSYGQSFGDALAQALLQTKLLDTEKPDGNVMGTKKKKRKNKATVLFATSMAQAP